MKRLSVCLPSPTISAATEEAIIQDEHFSLTPGYLIVLDDDKFAEGCIQLQSDGKIVRAMGGTKLYIIKSQLAQRSTVLDFVFVDADGSPGIPLLGILYQLVGLSSAKTKLYCPTSSYISVVAMRRAAAFERFLGNLGGKEVKITSTKVNQTKKSKDISLGGGASDFALLDASSSKSYDNMTNDIFDSHWTYLAPTSYSHIDKDQDLYFIHKYDRQASNEGLLMKMADKFCKNRFPTTEFYKLKMVHEENLEEAKTLAGKVHSKLGVEFNGRKASDNKKTTSLNSLLEVTFFNKNQFEINNLDALSNKIDNSPGVGLMKDNACSISVSRIEQNKCPGNEDQQHYLVAGLKGAGKTEFIKSIRIAVKGHIGFQDTYNRTPPSGMRVHLFSDEMKGEGTKTAYFDSYPVMDFEWSSDGSTERKGTLSVLDTEGLEFNSEELEDIEETIEKAIRKWTKSERTWSGWGNWAAKVIPDGLMFLENGEMLASDLKSSGSSYVSKKLNDRKQLIDSIREKISVPVIFVMTRLDIVLKLLGGSDMENKLRTLCESVLDNSVLRIDFVENLIFTKVEFDRLNLLERDQYGSLAARDELGSLYDKWVEKNEALLSSMNAMLDVTYHHIHSQP